MKTDETSYEYPGMFILDFGKYTFWGVTFLFSIYVLLKLYLLIIKTYANYYFSAKGWQVWPFTGSACSNIWWSSLIGMRLYALNAISNCFVFLSNAATCALAKRDKCLMFSLPYRNWVYRIRIPELIFFDKFCFTKFIFQMYHNAKNEEHCNCDWQVRYYLSNKEQFS